MNSTSMIIYGTFLGSTVGERWTAAPLRRAYWFLENVPSYILGIFVGLLLSDGSLQLRKGRRNALFIFTQSLSHFPYFWFVFTLLSHFCPSLPYVYAFKRRGTVCQSLSFYTRYLPFLTTLYHMFYVNGIKAMSLRDITFMIS